MTLADDEITAAEAARRRVITVDDIPVITDLDETLHFLFEVHAAGHALTGDALGRLMSRVGRNAAPAILLTARTFGLLDKDAAPSHVPDAWSGAEFPMSCMRQVDWLDLFHFAGYTHDGKPADRPDGPVRLWRGSVPGYRRRWSWTSDRDRAEWFANRWRLIDDRARLWECVAPPESLLAFIHESGRHEAEYVVDTRGLDIREQAFE